MEGLGDYPPGEEVFDWFHHHHRESVRGSYRKIKKQQGTVASVFGMVNASIGTAVLTVPTILATMGWFVGLTALGVIALLSIVTSLMLVRVSIAERCRSYDSLIDTVLGKPALRAYQLCVLVSSFGVLIVVLIMAGDFMQSLSLLLTGHTVDRRVGIIACGGALMLPLAFLKTLSALASTAVLSVVFVGVMAFVVFLESVQAPVSPSVVPIQHDLLEVFRGLALLTLSMSYQTIAIPVFQEMKHKTFAAVTKVVYSDGLTVCSVYAVVGSVLALLICN